MKSRLIVAAVTLLAITGLAHAATPAKKKKSTPRSNMVRATYSHAPSSKTRSKTSTKAKGKSRKGHYAARRDPARQLAPTPDRYMEIQKALATRGYLKNEPNGVWDSASQDAMRQFQADQKLDASGKLTAASLIALGLGPKQDSLAASARVEPAQHPADPAPLPPAPLSPVPAQ